MVAEDELERIYLKGISPALFAGAREADPAGKPPVVIAVGAQPGSGKTRGSVTARGLVDHEVTSIAGDNFRPLHPDYEALMTTDPLAMPAVTAPALSYWVERALLEARDNQFSVLLEGTFRSPTITVSTLTDFRQAGYQVHVVAIAVPAWQSKLSILDRYVSDHAAGGAARWTMVASHDAGYRGTPKTIAAAIDAGIVDRVTIMDRGSAILHDELAPRTPDAALHALEAARARTPGVTELEQFSTRLQSDIAYLERTHQIDERSRPLVEALRDDERRLYGKNTLGSQAMRLAQIGNAIPASRATSAQQMRRARPEIETGHDGPSISR